MTIIFVNSNDVDQTILNFIKKNFKSTNLSVIYKWFRIGKIKLNDKKIKDTKIKLKLNDFVKIYDHNKIIKRDNFEIVDYKNLSIVYEDDNLLIVDKQNNLEIHSPININLDLIVKSYLIDNKKYDPNNENSFVVSHVHRLDKLTSGLVIYAKNKTTLTYFLENINNKNKIEKYYLAKLENTLLPEGLVEGYINYDRKLKKAIFILQQKENYKFVSQCNKIINKDKKIYEIQLLTGRKHQIRSICEFYNSSIINDFRYGAKKKIEKKIDLISYKIIFKNLDCEFSYLNNKIFLSKYNFDDENL